MTANSSEHYRLYIKKVAGAFAPATFSIIVIYYSAKEAIPLLIA